MQIVDDTSGNNAGARKTCLTSRAVIIADNVKFIIGARTQIAQLSFVGVLHEQLVEGSLGAAHAIVECVGCFCLGTAVDEVKFQRCQTRCNTADVRTSCTLRSVQRRIGGEVPVGDCFHEWVSSHLDFDSISITEKSAMRKRFGGIF